jgi:hypothetical protein
MIRAPHPPYSPDSASSDFCLFGYIEHCLRGRSFETADELFSVHGAILRGIAKSNLDGTVLEWIKRLEQCNTTNDENVESA